MQVRSILHAIFDLNNSKHLVADESYVALLVLASSNDVSLDSTLY